jgi:hypothetical protein
MVTDEKQESLRDRLRRARRRRRLPSRKGHEISAAGKEMRTPTEGEFFGNLEKATDELPHPRSNQNGGG